MSQLQPNLFIVGAPKCGTTAWVTYLSRHEDVFFCDPKEPHHFNTDIPEFRWVRSREDYLRLFADVGKAQAIGETSILYNYLRVAAGRSHAGRLAPENCDFDGHWLDMIGRKHSFPQFLATAGASHQLASQTPMFAIEGCGEILPHWFANCCPTNYHQRERLGFKS